MRKLLLFAGLVVLASPAWAQTGFKPSIDAKDPFVAQGETGHWVKFTIVLSDPDTVHFQNSRRHLFHYDAVTAGLPGFTGIPRAEFDAAALRNAGRRVLLGAVLFPKPAGGGGGIGIGFGVPGFGPGIGLPSPGGPFGNPGDQDFGVQLVGTDPLPRQLVVDAFAAVKAAVRTTGNASAFYMPTANQRAATEQDAQFFAAAGIEVSSPARWIKTEAVYSRGWAVGRLVRIETSEIDAAFASGRLTPQDILLTDGVPNDMPRVAGIVTLSPASDNSHVAILAQTWEIPFVFPAADSIQGELTRLEGKRVLLRVGHQGSTTRIDDLDHVAQPLIDSILELKAPRAIGFPAAERRGAPGLAKNRDDLWLDTRGLTPADAKFVGGKAAHFGILHGSLPDESPRAIALTYDLFEAFFAVEHNGAPLNERTAALMAKHQAILDAASPAHSYPADRLPELRADLAALQDTIRDEVRLPSGVRDDVLAILADHFPADQPLRFRSSSNLEDGEFSGAGLYRSASSRSRTRRVFRAIRRVYASFYNERAVLERLRHRVNEAEVFMGLAVHRTFPDEIELANGVATFHARDVDSYTLELATQLGATSTVLPDEGTVAELVRIQTIGTFKQAVLERSSNLVPLGGHVLAWENGQAEYKQLADLLARVAARYASVTGVEAPQLDLEFKKLRENGTERFVIKQVRPLPQRAAPSDRVFLIQPAVLRAHSVTQGEQSDSHGLHRLKCEVQLGLRGTGFELSAQALNQPFLDSLSFRSAEDGVLTVREGDPATWAGASFSFDPASRHARVSWAREDSNPGTTSLLLRVPARQQAEDSPVILFNEAHLRLEATYRDLAPTSIFGSTGTLLDSATLGPIHTGERPTGSTVNPIGFTSSGGLELRGSVVWPPNPFAGGISAGYTAPLMDWEGPVELEGLLPGVTLTFNDHFSRTYRPHHHNFGLDMTLEPALSPSVSQAVKDRLRAMRIRKIHLSTSMGALTEDFAGKLEPWPRPAGAAAVAQPAPPAAATDGLEDALEESDSK